MSSSLEASCWRLASKGRISIEESLFEPSSLSVPIRDGIISLHIYIKIIFAEFLESLQVDARFYVS